MTKRLPVTQKLIQSTGDLVVVARASAMGAILFYYSAVIGIPATLVSLALGITIVIDAISDPVIGAWSDRTRSKLGRRHPFMYAGIIPMAIGLYALMAPPAGLGDWGYFTWVLGATIVINLAYTVFVVPYAALLSESSQDYDERTEVAAYRGLYVIGGTAFFTILSYGIFFAATPDYPQGYFNPAGYHSFALFAAGTVLIAGFTATHFTRRYITDRPAGLDADQGQSPKDLWAGFITATRNRNFLILFLAALTNGLVDGAEAALATHMYAFFWEFRSEDLVYLSLVAVGSAVGLVIARPLQSVLEKKTIYLITGLFLIVSGWVLMLTWLAGWLPEKHSTRLLTVFIMVGCLRGALLTVMVVVVISMIGDVAVEQDYKRGKQQGGVMFAGLGFADKAVAGVGVLFGGVILDLLNMPRQVTSGTDVDPTGLLWLGVAAGIIIPGLKLIPMAIMLRYHLRRDQYAAMLQALDQREAAAATIQETSLATELENPAGHERITNAG